MILLLTGILSSVQAQQLKSDTFDVVHYDLHLDIMNFQAKQLNGFAILTLTPKMNQLSYISLDLLSLQVDSVKVEGQPVVSWYQDDTLLRIPLISPVSVGDTFQMRIRYHGTPIVEPAGWGGFHFDSWIAYNLGIAFQANPHNYGRAWFPCIDDFIDRATYDYYITTEAGKTAVCGGLLIDSIVHPDNSITWHWKMNQTIPAYLASVAVASYIKIADIYNGIQTDIPISLYFRPSDTAAVNNLFVNLKNILSVYENHWGAYSFDRVGYVGTIQGAMEHAANIALPVSTLSSGYEWLYAHELSHMWFGDKITCSSAEDMWLNEGWAVFNESLYREGIYGYPAYRSNMNSKLANVLQYCHIKDNGYRALYGIPNEYTYGETVYQKGGVVVHTLRNYLGDSLFFPAISNFLQDYAFQPVSSFQLRDYLTQYTGIDMTPFFDGWVFSPGFPCFVIDSCQMVPSGQNFLTTVFVHQKLKGAPEYYHNNRLFISFIDSLWNTHDFMMEFSGEFGSQTFVLPFKPTLCLADYYDRIADATTDASLRIHSSGDYDFPNTFFRLSITSLADSAFFRVTHNWAAPDSLKTPLPGLTLFDYRYWRIEGIYHVPFQAKGRFFYSRPSHLDDSLLQNLNDSLVILYRKNASEEWQGIPFTRTGTLAGYITVNDLQPGEYTLASWDEYYVGKTEIILTDNKISIHPNPVLGHCTIKVASNHSSVLKIYASSGVLLLKKPLPSGTHELNYDFSRFPAGFYIARLEDTNGHSLAHEKFIVGKR